MPSARPRGRIGSSQVGSSQLVGGLQYSERGELGRFASICGCFISTLKGPNLGLGNLCFAWFFWGVDSFVVGFPLVSLRTFGDLLHLWPYQEAVYVGEYIDI